MAVLGLGFEPQGAAVHYRTNRVTYMVRASQIDTSKEHRATLETKLGVDVGFRAVGEVRDTSASECDTSHRRKCYGPFRIGVQVFYPKSYPDDDISNICTMGFHVYDPDGGAKDHTFLTAGHCVYNKTAPWHHHDHYNAYYGRIGASIADKYNSTRQRDIAVIEIENWNANKTTRIFSDSGWSEGAKMQNEGQAIEGESLCISLGATDLNRCGTIDGTHQWWMSTTHNPNIKMYGYGFDFNDPAMSVTYGDSGSPMYRQITISTVPPTPGRVPIGIQAAASFSVPSAQETHDVYFTSVYWALNNSGGWPELEIYRGAQGSP